MNINYKAENKENKQLNLEKRNKQNSGIPKPVSALQLLALLAKSFMINQRKMMTIIQGRSKIFNFKITIMLIGKIWFTIMISKSMV